MSKTVVSTCVRLAFLASALLAVPAVFSPVCRAQARQTPEKLVLAAGQEGGVYLKLARAIADAAKKNGLDIEVLPSSGSVENIRSLAEGRAQLAFVQSDVAHRAWARHEPFEKLSPLQSSAPRLVAPLYTEVVQVLVRPHLYISTTRGLRGRSVSLGRKGSGTHQTARAVLEASGLSEDDLTPPLHLSLEESTIRIKEGTIDAVVRTSSVPTPLVAEVLRVSEARLLRLDREVTDRLVEGESYIETAIPKDTYPNQTKLVPTVAVQAFLLARGDVPAEVITQLLQILRNKQRTIERAASVQLEQLARDIRPELRTHLHPAGVLYFPESKDWAGVWLNFFLLAFPLAVFGSTLVLAYRKRIRNSFGSPLRIVGLLVIFTWLIGSGGLHYLEAGVNVEIDSYAKSAWSVLGTVAPLPNALEPMTEEGKSFAFIVAAVGLAWIGMIPAVFAAHRVKSDQLMTRSLTLLLVLLILIGIWILGSAGLYHYEGDVNEDFDSYAKSAWSMLVYVAGGFQARVPVTREGEVVAVFATAVGVALIAWVAGHFATELVAGLVGTIGIKVGTLAEIAGDMEARLNELVVVLRGRKKMPELKDHIVIVNWDDRVKDMILELHGRTFREKVPIVIVSEAGVRLPEQKEFDEVAEIVGDPVSKRTLERAEAHRAHSITILSSWPLGEGADRRRKLDPEVADAKTITTILAVRQLPGGESVPITAEVRAKKNCESALNAGGGQDNNIEIVCAEEFGTDILTQCAVTPGLATLYTDLLTFSPESNEIYRIKVPENLVGKTFGELLHAFADLRTTSQEAIIPLGISRGSKTYLNPRDDNKELGTLEPEDFLFVMSYTEPELA